MAAASRASFSFRTADLVLTRKRVIGLPSIAYLAETYCASSLAVIDLPTTILL